MKIISVILYIICGILLLIALLGSSATKPLLTSLSERTLEYSGFKKSYVQTVDNKIDDLIYQSRQIELQIEKIKNFFSSEKIDESKYQRENTAMLENSFYNPLVGMFNLFYRIGFAFAGIFVLTFAVIFHLISNGSNLRKRVRRLEELVSQNRNTPQVI